jgi:hypothetical protein
VLLPITWSVGALPDGVGRAETPAQATAALAFVDGEAALAAEDDDVAADGAEP